MRTRNETNAFLMTMVYIYIHISKVVNKNGGIHEGWCQERQRVNLTFQSYGACLYASYCMYDRSADTQLTLNATFRCCVGLLSNSVWQLCF